MDLIPFPAPMHIIALKTRKLLPPKDNLFSALKDSIPTLPEKSIVCIASKVVSINEGRCIPFKDVPDKDELIKSESDLFLPREATPNSWVMHTIVQNILLPTSGIDESNSNGHFILYPKDPKASAKQLWEFLTKEYKVKDLGVVITDSHSVPLRRGLVGFCLSYFGFTPLYDYRGEKDLFDRELKVSMSNIPDSLASIAVLVMGEGDEQTPVALISDLDGIEFTEKEYTSDIPYSSYEIDMKEDLFEPFLTSVPWQKGKK